MEDLNTREYLEKIKIQVFESLRNTGFAPSVQGHEEPRLAHDTALEDVDDDGLDPDVRSGRSQKERDDRIQKDGELSDSEDEGEGGRRDRRDHSNKNGNEKRKPGIMDPLLKNRSNGRISLSPKPNGNSFTPDDVAKLSRPPPDEPFQAQVSTNQNLASTSTVSQPANVDAGGDTEMNDGNPQSTTSNAPSS